MCIRDRLGTQQSGVLSLRIADLVRDRELLQSAREFARQLLLADPGLEQAENRVVRTRLQQMEVFQNRWDYIS